MKHETRTKDTYRKLEHERTKARQQSQENSGALAEALSELVAAHRHSKAFQLVVITHDTDFVEMLARHNVCEFYSRVVKVNGASCIERVRC